MVPTSIAGVRLHILWLDPDPAPPPKVVAGLASTLLRLPSIADALRALREVSTDVVVAEVLLPGLSGFELARRLAARDAAPPVLLRTRLSADWALPRAIRVGARGFVQASAAPEVLAEALRSVAGGRVFWDAAAPGPVPSSAVGADERSDAARLDGLSPRLFEALHLNLQGMDSAAVAAAMHVTRRSAAGYRREVCRVLSVAPEGDLSEVAALIDAPFYTACRAAAVSANKDPPGPEG
ncbi:MAG: response regulator transcription factor [Rhodocyclaceae bacterium]|nr:response regulator transcription factor [Rhodocyclaceae bacterium]